MINMVTNLFYYVTLNGSQCLQKHYCNCAAYSKGMGSKCLRAWGLIANHIQEFLQLESKKCNYYGYVNGIVEPNMPV